MLMQYLRHPKRRNTLQTVLLWACMMIPTSALLYGTSAHMRETEKELSAVREALAQEHEQTRVLKAEWAYLNNPKQLASRAARYLDMKKAASPAQVAELNDIPVKIAYRTPDVTPVAEQADGMRLGMMQITPSTQPLSTHVLAKSIVYDEHTLANLHENEPVKLPAAASWSQKLVSALSSAGIRTP